MCVRTCRQVRRSSWSRSFWRSSLRCCRVPSQRLRPSSKMLLPSWMIPYIYAAPAPQVRPLWYYVTWWTKMSNIKSPKTKTQDQPFLLTSYTGSSSWTLSFSQCSLCFLNTDYLVNRAEAALGSVDKMKKGHADYLRNMGGEFAHVLVQHGAVDVANCSLTVCSCNQMLEGCWGLWPSSPTWQRIQLSTAAPLHTWHPLTMLTVRNIRDHFLGMTPVILHCIYYSGCVRVCKACTIMGCSSCLPFFTLQGWQRTAEAVPLRVFSSWKTWSPRPPSRGQTQPLSVSSFRKSFTWVRWGSPT